ncbi:MAG TPA: hypothetical protein VFG09_11960 [Thermodesulfovibrionales bacterium]|nr:hypothetical protein [Thermodesulfovibrionales bacterium]
MRDEKGQLPFDTRLLSEAIIELNICRRNVSIYPREHPAVERSLDRVFEFIQKLFELRDEITLAVAGDVLIVDDFFLDKKNPVYREFALHMNRMNIASVTFITGLTREELYEFHFLLSDEAKDFGPDDVKGRLRERKVAHIRIDFVDYRAFALREGRTETEAFGRHLWDRYVHALLQGTLLTDDVSDAVHDIPPDELAKVINKTASGDLSEESYDRVIISYLKRSMERVFSSAELKRVMDFISGLRPDLKKQFLSSSVNAISRDMESAHEALKGLPVEDVINILAKINEQNVAVPEVLRNLLEKFSEIETGAVEDLTFRGNLIADDVFLSSDVMDLLVGHDFEKFVTRTYQSEIEKIMRFNVSRLAGEGLKELENECSEENMEKAFHALIRELLVSKVVTEEEYRYFIDTLYDQAEEFIGTGQYGAVLKTLGILETNHGEGIFPDLTSGALAHYHTPEFIAQFTDSLRMVGRQAREEAQALCDHYGDEILPALFDALAEEKSQALRSFFISLITHFGPKIVPEAIKRLNDSRWYVKRNMLLILSECDENPGLYALPYCHHENVRVSFEAIKCLLKAGDRHGHPSLRDYMRHESREVVEQAILLSGVYRVKELVPDLLQMLRKKGVSGADFYEKIRVVKALGDIGDARSIPALREVLSMKSILFKGTLDDLKGEIYKTLKKYPFAQVRDLVEAGTTSKNDTIREESLKLKRLGQE